jgi:hypothetical protein
MRRRLPRRSVAYPGVVEGYVVGLLGVDKVVLMMKTWQSRMVPRADLWGGVLWQVDPAGGGSPTAPASTLKPTQGPKADKDKAKGGLSDSKRVSRRPGSDGGVCRRC